MEVKIKVYDEVKYNPYGKKIAECKYDNVKKFETVTEPDTIAEIECRTDADGIDENHEYLVLYFDNGETSTFRNSHVDYFII